MDLWVQKLNVVRMRKRIAREEKVRVVADEGGHNVWSARMNY